jgi:hypothetical protein
MLEARDPKKQMAPVVIQIDGLVSLTIDATKVTLDS